MRRGRQDVSRREFLSTAGRAGALLALGGVGSGLIAPRYALGRGGGGTQVCPTAPGTVTFPHSAIISSNATSADEHALHATIKHSWKRYLALDASGVTSYMTSDITRLSGRWGSGTIEYTAAQVANALPGEWSAREFADNDPAKGLAEQFTIEKATFDVDASGNFATVNYWVSVIGGARWCYSEVGWVLQVLTKVDGSWKICHQIDGWSSDVDPVTMEGSELFRFDYFSPVTNLTRAVNFYQPLLGVPETVTSNQATWVCFRNSRFILDATRLGGVVNITAGLPNGWGTIYVSDVQAERDALKAAGVTFIAGTSTQLLTTAAGDQYAVGLDDPSGGSNNIFVIMQKNLSTTGPTPAAPSGFNLSDPYQAASQQLATAWVTQDTATIRSLFGSNGSYYDDTRDRAIGLITGGSNIASALSSTLWPRYDRSSGGLSANLQAYTSGKYGSAMVKTRNIGSQTVVSYLQELKGTGVHPFDETAFATDVFDANMNLVFMVRIAVTAQPTALTRSLDYSLVPNLKLNAEDTFYSQTMGFGTPYEDTAYRGWWSDDQIVYGTSKCNPSKNLGLPIAGNANGYMSFWVSSAQLAYNQLSAQGAGFPVFQFINSQSGVDPQPGYNQVLFTDSEGNDNVCTEYTGL
jgi:hypothetical protein